MKKRKTFCGLLLILAAVLVLLNATGILGDIHIWRLCLAIVMVALIVKSIPELEFGGILFPIAILCILYSDILGLERLTPWPVLIAALLGSIGLDMMIGKKKYKTTFQEEDREHFNKVVNDSDASHVQCDVNFNSVIKYINTDNLERADLRCSFGALKVYCDNALIQKGEAQIVVDISFAGVELYLPANWRVDNQIRTSLGGVEERNKRMNADGPVVKLGGNVSFGGLTIIYV
ncbi:MAG: hypothetical protein PHP50_10915 [Lachnospiraceae bacterium]|nr:hypothetical protein [Lachnospiraceae bacterium]